MSEQHTNNNQQENVNLTQAIKENAGAAFHAVHKGLETTENVAMNTVDQVSNAIKNVTNPNENNRRAEDVDR